MLHHFAAILLNGLRKYEIEPQVWGGDSACDHQFGDDLRHLGPSRFQGKTGDRADRGGAPQREQPRAAGAFCLCGAWRGDLGLEPTLALYIEHLVDVFAAVHRVLRPDGVVFLNIGDTYASRPNGSIGKESRLEGAYTAHTEFRRAHALRTSTQPAGFKHKDRMMVPARVAIALQEWGWYLRDEIVWNKRNCMPGSQKDRTTASHEMVYMLSKSQRYHYDHTAIREPFSDGRMGADYPRPNAPDKIASPHGKGFTRAAARPESVRNRGGRTDGFTKPNNIDPSANGGRTKRSVWTISTEASSEEHFAVMPKKLVEPCVLAGCPIGGTVLDPFAGIGTVPLVADALGRNAIGIELGEGYAAIARRRPDRVQPERRQAAGDPRHSAVIIAGADPAPPGPLFNRPETSDSCPILPDNC